MVVYLELQDDTFGTLASLPTYISLEYQCSVANTSFNF
jgi:hypothetical protein